MEHYYVNKVAQITGEHEVHTSSCSFLPSSENRIYLGQFYNCDEALNEARKHYPKVDGCYYCCYPCHKR